MTSKAPWEEIALQYRREIEILHKDIENAIEEIEKKMPRCLEKGIGILEYALSSSQENLFLIKLMEYPIIVQKTVKDDHKENANVSDCFEGLL